MSKRKGAKKSRLPNGLLDDSVQCPECKNKGKCYLVGGLGFFNGSKDVEQWLYECVGCGCKFSVTELVSDDEERSSAEDASHPLP